MVTTYVIDEASMLDLELAAALFRAINWTTVQRVILVGDPSQLPPIGSGRVFADIIDWLRANHPDSVGELTENLRQMENRLDGRGTGILELASVYVRSANGPESEGRRGIDSRRRDVQAPPGSSPGWCGGQGPSCRFLERSPVTCWTNSSLA